MVKFINPYNFIPLGECNKEPICGREKLTGYISYQLKTKSSIFIPNTSSDKAFEYVHTKNEKGEDDDPNNEHILQDFFSLNDLQKEKKYDNTYFEPIIPGSSIRGVFRSVYETLTGSCLSQVNDTVMIGKRTVEHFLPGLIKREGGDYNLYEVDDTLVRNKLDFSELKYKSLEEKDGSKVKVLLSKKNGRAKREAVISSDGNCVGYLIKGEAGPEMAPNASILKNKCAICVMKETGKCNPKNTENCKNQEKHCAHVFVPKDRKIGWINEQELKRLGYVIEQYQNETEKSYDEYKNTYGRFINGEIDALPVYYSFISSGNCLLSPACITREVYKNTVSDAINKWKKCNPIKTAKEKICPACALFGFINQSNSSDGFSKGSNIRFTDLKLKDVDTYHGDFKRCYDKKLYVMPELSQPKISNTEFYLVKPVDNEGEVWFWTYDYYTVKMPNGSVIVKEYTPQISGRKYYWHGDKLAGYSHKTNRNKTVRTVKKDVCFEGKLYFDGITKKQLDQLIYILNYSSDEKHGFKVGSGKPVGLGSVSLCVLHTKIRSFEENYSVHDYIAKDTDWNSLDFDKGIQASFESVTHFLTDEDMKIVHYPGVNSEGDEGFVWFADNKKYHKLASYKADENILDTRDLLDKSPRARIQTKILQTLKRPEENKYLNENISKGIQTTNHQEARKRYNLTDHVCEHPECNEKTTLDFKGKPYRFCKNHRPNIKR